MADTLYLIFIEREGKLSYFNTNEGFLSYADANNFIEGRQRIWEGKKAKLHIVSCSIMKTIEVKNNGTR